MEYDKVVATLRETYAAGRTRPLSWRYDKLRALRALLTEQSATLYGALDADLGKNATEAYTTEIGFVIAEIDHILKHLREWTRPRRIAVPAFLKPAGGRVIREPLGVVLIISPWNYPVQLTLAPLAGALAAGNCAVLKPSEISARTSAVLAELLPEYLGDDTVAVVQGGVPETTGLLEQRFDQIFYTGNGAVGRIVMAAAAKHLTPVVLELGGKSPALVEPGVDLTGTARRIVWGKFLNAGQTCVAPDYVLAIGDTAQALEQPLADAITEMYGENPATSPDYGRIVSTKHFDRLVALLGDGRTVAGGRYDRAARYIAPTVVADVDPAAPVMTEEIFGPILPIVSVPDLDAAIAFINERDKPLALYAFTDRDETKRRLTAWTSSGGLCFGIPAAHLAVPGLPFGGVGESGLGRYHGEHSIDAFSHTKAVLDKPLAPDTWRVAYPPFNRVKRAVLRRLI